MLDDTCEFAQPPSVLEPALLAEYRDERVGVTVPESVVVLEPRNLIHVLEVSRVSVEQSHPVFDRLAVLVFD
jgi:hypothetical protein